MKISALMTFMGAFLATLAMTTSALAANQTVNFVYEFLRLADNGDFAALPEKIDSKSQLSGKKLLKKIQGCYLRRVYSTPQDGVLSAWMCADGPAASRVILMNIAKGRSGVLLSVQMETRNPLPAPERSGPALSEDSDNG